MGGRCSISRTQGLEHRKSTRLKQGDWDHAVRHMYELRRCCMIGWRSYSVQPVGTVCVYTSMRKAPNTCTCDVTVMYNHQSYARLSSIPVLAFIAAATFLPWQHSSPSSISSSPSLPSLHSHPFPPTHSPSPSDSSPLHHQAQTSPSPQPATAE